MKSLKYKLKSMRSSFFVMVLMLASGGSLMAQDNTGGTFWTEETILYTVLGMVFLVAVLVLVVALYVLQLLRTFLLKDISAEQRAKYEAEPGYFVKLWSKWNDFKPIEEEEEILLDHNYDGIKELDNHLPPWWKGLFYITVIYAVVYLLIFHVFETRPLQAEQYELEMAAAQDRLNMLPQPEVDFDETSVTLSEEPADLLKGKEIFERSCATCHKADGGGLAGPNLTDQYWKHGGGIKNIYATVKNGVPNTAMISWEQALNPVMIRQVASYVISLEGSNPPGAKGPEGEVWVPQEAAPTDSTANQ